MLHHRATGARNGKALRRSIPLSDMSEEARTLKALRESEARFRGMFDDAAIGIALLGIDFTWVKINRRFCRIVGYTQVKLLQRTIVEITHPDDIQKYLRIGRRRWLGGRAARFRSKRACLVRTAGASGLI